MRHSCGQGEMAKREPRVQWSGVARRDVERLAAYLAEEAPLRADAIIERILSRVDALQTLPGRGRTIPELRGVADENWRELQERPWRIIYQIRSSSSVMIHGVLDGRRDLQDILMERLLSP